MYRNGRAITSSVEATQEIQRVLISLPNTNLPMAREVVSPFSTRATTGADGWAYRVRRVGRKSIAKAAKSYRVKLDSRLLRTCDKIAQYRDSNITIALRVGACSAPGGRRSPLSNIVSHVLNIELGRFPAGIRRRRRCW